MGPPATSSVQGQDTLWLMGRASSRTCQHFGGVRAWTSRARGQCSWYWWRREVILMFSPLPSGPSRVRWPQAVPEFRQAGCRVAAPSLRGSRCHLRTAPPGGLVGGACRRATAESQGLEGQRSAIGQMSRAPGTPTVHFQWLKKRRSCLFQTTCPWPKVPRSCSIEWRLSWCLSGLFLLCGHHGKAPVLDRTR